MSSQAQQHLLHILVVPFQQEGHVNGMLGLAQALVTAHEGVLVTFGYPARFHSLALKHNKLLALDALNVHAQHNSLLRIEVLDDGLPPDEEQGITGPLLIASIPTYQHSVKLLFDRLFLQREFSGDDNLTCAGTSVEQQLPAMSCIISDTFLPWTQDLADAAGLLRVDFWTSTAAVYSMGTQLSRLVSKGVLPLPKSCWANADRPWKAEAPLIEGVPGLPPFPATDFLSIVLLAENPLLQFMLDAFRPAKQAHTILIHSVYELESRVFDALQADGFPAYAVGPFLQRVANGPTSRPTGRHECLQWLDTQAPSSVIYIALGTVAKLEPTEMRALARGLEASKHPFLWVIRTDSISSSLADALPGGFLERTRHGGTGHIISWAPQTEVLSHPSTGAFFSHCGWNSTIESMWEGVPMVTCPREAEQRSNARWIVDNWKVGVELERQDDGSFTKEAVQRALREVLQSEGAQYKERALHAKQVARCAMQQNGSSKSNLTSLLRRLTRGSNYN